MNNNLIIGIFTDEHDILQAVEKTRQSGYEIYDVYTPYAIHGMDEAFGLKPSRLPFICFTWAFIGLTLALLLQFWIGSIDWPLNVGGKPFNSLPAYLPVTFELTVLFAGLGVFFTMLFRNRLYPSKKISLVDELVLDNHFVIAVEAKDMSIKENDLKSIWEHDNLLEIRHINLEEM